MSLINDALKRAKQTHKDRGPASPGGPPLQPHDSNHGSSKALLLLLIAVLALGGAGYWYFTGKKMPFGVGAKKVQPATNQLAKTKSKPLMAAVKGSNSAVSPPPGGIARTNPLPTANKLVSSEPSNAIPQTMANAKRDETKPSEPVKPAVQADSNQSKPIQPAANTADAKPTGFPELKLQGIYFRFPRPSVLINGKTLFNGDTVDGARIVEIERHQVKVEFGNQKKVLTLD